MRSLLATESTAPRSTQTRQKGTTATRPTKKCRTLEKKTLAGILSTTTTSSGALTARFTRSVSSTNTAPTTRSITKPSLLRQPLEAGDQNVAAATTRTMRSTPSSRAQPLAKIPHDKSANSAKPQMATVSRANFGKQPLTPKIAARSTTAPAVAPISVKIAASTPQARQGTRPESALGSKPSKGLTPLFRDNRDDADSSPVATFFDSNMTPRSESRQSRVHSTHTIPNGTSNPDLQDRDTSSGIDVSSSAAEDEIRMLSLACGAPPEAKQDTDAKFFYASDAQFQSAPPTQPRPFAPPQKAATFCYASGGTINHRQKQPPIQITPIGSPQVDLMSKFVYACRSPDALPAAVPPPLAPPSTAPAGPTLSRTYTGGRPPSTIGIPTQPSVWPALPHKHPCHVASRGSGVRDLSPAAVRHPVAAAPPNPRRLSVEAPLTLGRASSETGSRLGKHSRQNSLVEPFSAAPVTRPVSGPSSATSSPSTPAHPPLALYRGGSIGSGCALLLQAAQDFAGETETEENARSAPSDASLHSPSMATSQDAQLDELVANARRERKVQDLQITNASLEAINRTLERQLRKLTAELRRYKRLSRAGRLSLMPEDRSRVTSDSSVEGGQLVRTGMQLDHFSEVDSEDEGKSDEVIELDEDQDEDEFSGSEDGAEPGHLSLEAAALRSGQHRSQDERRLRLDLTKHQELLIDSQKINKSIRRCLGWTEELIQEGKRALMFKVLVSEVETGGRVLAPEEIERDEGNETVGSFAESLDEAEGRSTGEEEGPGPPQDRGSEGELAVLGD